MHAIILEPMAAFDGEFEERVDELTEIVLCPAGQENAGGGRLGLSDWGRLQAEVTFRK